ncbi:sodium/hydrogen exchanger 1, putative [Babesia bigemina]|uniref:Sodium/hydrogen exchanger 1, putative n=1 Tax=Babesia bigemina TaxID=5866 RepID=A0A061D4Z7_BABBI|nr:sodium/hydrogen exchanger 1, putative [Babesia bigemina]CDR94034.1 sodium/hydrogen exchanger 1, putative [Babesia bigemina]|eukprot:XP_012766220.1 sodium/hydrogen exchanger 1, putative [Babesia bigemina]
MERPAPWRWRAVPLLIVLVASSQLWHAAVCQQPIKKNPSKSDAPHNPIPFTHPPEAGEKGVETSSTGKAWSHVQQAAASTPLSGTPYSKTDHTVAQDNAGSPRSLRAASAATNRTTPESPLSSATFSSAPQNPSSMIKSESASIPSGEIPGETDSHDPVNGNPAAVSPNVAQFVTLTSFIFLSACVLQFIISKVNNRIPISIACFIFGMITYGFTVLLEPYGRSDPLSLSINGLRHIDSSILYYAVLPILLYEATQEINWYAFCSFFLGGVSLAIIGVVLQVCLLGTIFHYVLNIAPNQSVTISFLLASILSSTDPVAVLAVLSGVKAHPKLSSIFNGESLINDGSSMLLFQFFYLLLVGQPRPFWYHGLVFCQLLLLSPLLGVLVGVVVAMWISHFRKHHSAQCIAVITCGHLLFFLSEYTMNLSGPLSLVCYGIFIKVYGVMAFDREALEKHHHLVEGLCLMANSAVFLISGALTVGMLRSQFSRPNVMLLLWKLFGMYLLLNLARALMIVVFSPLLSYIGYGVNWKETILVILGGLRGALVLVLGLRLESDTHTPQEVSDLLAFYLGGNVMLILLIQGLTFELVYRWLSPYPMKPFRRVYLVKVMNLIDYEFNLEVDWLRNHWLFKNTDAVERARTLVPLMSTIRWNATGNLEFDVPDIDKPFDDYIQPDPIELHVYQENMQFEAMTTLHSCKSVRSRSSAVSGAGEKADVAQPASAPGSGDAPGDKAPDNSCDCLKCPEEPPTPAESRSDEPEGPVSTDRPLLAYSILKNKVSSDNAAYDPKRYLRLLEHAMTDDMGEAPEMHRLSSDLLSVPRPSMNPPGMPAYGSQEGISPYAWAQRSDTDATINLDNLYQRPVHKRFITSTLVPRLNSDDRIFENCEHESADGNMPGTRRVLRKEREGELYIMIFNAFSDMYNRLYESALIDGGSLLLLQNALDRARDFALKKMKKRAIAAWEAVLASEPGPDSGRPEPPEGVESMNGFEFEWFILHSMVDKRMSRMDSCLGWHVLNFSQHNVVQSVLELLVAYIDVHQHLLDRGGRNMELLLEGKLINSYRSQLGHAKLYIATLRSRFPQDFSHGLVTMAACMMLRIKLDVVNEQSTQGLLLEEDRSRVVEVLEEQLFNVATTNNRINVFKRLFKRAFQAVTCRRGRGCNGTSQ